MTVVVLKKEFVITNGLTKFIMFDDDVRAFRAADKPRRQTQFAVGCIDPCARGIDDEFRFDTVAAFKTLAISNQTEQFITAALRAAKALTVSLVAEVDGRVVGHIAFSPVTISDGSEHWYGLGPVSVLPEYQRKGIGKALIQKGLSRLKDFKAQGCCLVGHPEYYKKFGFDNIPELVRKGVPPEVFLALSFDGKTPRGTVTFHEGFKANGQQERAADALQRA